MADPADLHAAVGRWYAEHARDLPWRKPPYLGHPYAVLVSEVMLQQTQVDRTIPKFLAFMSRFPSITALADAPLADVITMWSGMGYNNRAVRLHRLARTVVDEHRGRLPSSMDDLLALPGIGPYTAAAVACFAFDASVPVLDTNIYRVLSRVQNGAEAPNRSAIGPIAQGLVPPPGAFPGASLWHQALMDIGATICSVSMPRCMLCPLRTLCAAAPVLQAGNRRLAEASVPYAPKQSRFAGSTRYFRGRIVETLRNAEGAAVPIAALLDQLAAQPTFDTDQLSTIIGALVKDGLVVRQGDSLRLP